MSSLRKSAFFRFRQLWALSRLTALEVVRQPICLLITISGILLMALSSLQAFQFGEDGKLARDSCFAIHFIFGLFLGVYASCTVLTDEIRNGTALVVLSKPVSREVFFLSKFFGITILVVVFSACAIAASLLTEKASPKFYFGEALPLAAMLCAVIGSLAVAGIANYVSNRPFASTAFMLLLVFMLLGLATTAALHNPASGIRVYEGHAMQVSTAIQWRIIPAGLLVTMALVVLSAVALTFATRLDTIPVLIASTFVFFAGLLSDYLFGYLGAASPMAGLGHTLVPNWQYFWMADALTHRATISPRYLVLAAGYAICFVTAILGVGVMLFRNREIK